jgi:ABC-type nickel/cobalt efflux system permease component RcnA
MPLRAALVLHLKSGLDITNKENIPMKKIAMTLIALFALSSAVSFADEAKTETHVKDGDAKMDSTNEAKTDTSHNALTGKTTHTRKHKKHHMSKDANGHKMDKETTTTEKTTVDDAHK